MLSRKGILPLAVVAGLLIVLVGCGGGSDLKLAPPATGSFNNASLSGTYAFSITGQNFSFNSFGLPESIVGSITADGNGNITAGVADVNNGGSGVFTNVTIQGNYSVGPDGRGTAVLGSSAGTFTVDFVIVSSQRALVTRFDGNATASGSMDLQDATAFSAAALQGQFAFSVAGVDQNLAPMQVAGIFTTDGGSTISAGLEDVNDGGGLANNVPLNGVYAVGSNGRGTLALTTPSGTLNFAFYVVNRNHIKMVETDTIPLLSGDAFRQQGAFSNAAIAGPVAFTLGGGLSAPFVAGGVFSADGNGTISGGTLDVNDNGSVSQNQNLTGTYSIAANGRGTMALVSNGTTRNFVVYPSSGGLLMMQTDTNMVSSGVALPQSANAFSSASFTGNYGFNLTGLSSSGEVDVIARIAADGNGKLKGAGDFNFAGALFQNLDYSGSYSLSSNGRGTATLKSSNGTQNFGLYAVDGTRILFVELDASGASVGDFEQQ